MEEDPNNFALHVVKEFGQALEFAILTEMILSTLSSRLPGPL
jgi:hypothetical protein